MNVSSREEESGGHPARVGRAFPLARTGRLGVWCGTVPPWRTPAPALVGTVFEDGRPLQRISSLKQRFAYFTPVPSLERIIVQTRLAHPSIHLSIPKKQNNFIPPTQNPTPRPQTPSPSPSRPSPSHTHPASDSAAEARRPASRR